jgi:hypothetical protein
VSSEKPKWSQKHGQQNPGNTVLQFGSSQLRHELPAFLCAGESVRLAMANLIFNEALKKRLPHIVKDFTADRLDTKFWQVCNRALVSGCEAGCLPSS